MILNTFDDTKGPPKPANVGIFGEESSQKMKNSMNNFQKNTLQNTTICKELIEGLKVFEI